MILINKLREIYAKRNSKSYVKYLRKIGISIGENTVFISPRQSEIDLNRALFISIGNNCVLSSRVSIVAHDYSWKNIIISDNVIYPSGGKEIRIGNNVFVGTNSVILGGVEIGDNSIIAAGSIVCKSVPENAVYGGNPARQISTLEEFKIKRKNSFLDEAKANAQLIYKKTGRNPTIKEMKNYVVLFLPRKHEMFAEFILNSNLIGIEKEVYVTLLKDIDPLYESFESFLNDALN